MDLLLIKLVSILRVTQDGQPVTKFSFRKFRHPLILYYAYGIRNNFGIILIILTENLWDTENGPNYGDEINIVYPGFNSGWVKGTRNLVVKGKIGNENPGSLKIQTHPIDLVNFGGRGKYFTTSIYLV